MSFARSLRACFTEITFCCAGVLMVPFALSQPDISGSGVTGGVVSNYVLNGLSYRAHIFTNSGVFTIPDGPLACDVLIVAGGGGSSGDLNGGGGGAGGLIYTNMQVAAGDYPVVVGSGGTGCLYAIGNNGSNSSFGPYTAIGGGAGGCGGGYTSAAANGGSGGGAEGGAMPYCAQPGTGVVSQGHNGGLGSAPGGNGSGGGGGAGAPGQDAYAGHAGNGGDGLSYDISGVTTYYAGGGGGADWSGNGVGGAGGLGGGGAGSTGRGGDGQPNTGGGGGGTERADRSNWGDGPPYYTGGSGGSGVVIVRYVTPSNTFLLSLASNGYGFVAGGGWYVAGSNVLLVATPASNHQFVSWNDGVTNATRTILMPSSNVIFTATFVPVSGSGVAGGVVSNYVLNGLSYRAHIFTNSGVFTIPDGPLACDVLIVAGGGGSSGDLNGGGGGAGGLIYTNMQVAAGDYPVVVGSGGTGCLYAIGNNGSNSSFGPYTAIGGGAGGCGGGYTSAAANGGSGGGAEGGAMPYCAQPGTGVVSQGHNGGLGSAPGGNGSGGGGGAGAPGQDAYAGHAGNGGDGLSYDISGVTTYYAGGGGGADWSGNGVGGAGGLGGGGAGSTGRGGDGQPNTGGGGGGTERADRSNWGDGPPYYTGGSGGSGVVIVRYRFGIVSLGAISAHGGVYPGDMVTNYGTAINEFVVNSPVQTGSTQYLCTGGAVLGNDFSAVSPTNVVLTLTNDASLIWNWSTNYWIATGTNGAGTISVASSWQPACSNVVICAVPGVASHFVMWSGTTNGCLAAFTTLTVSVSQPRTITAVFSAGATPVISGKVTRNGTSTGLAGVVITFSGAIGTAVTDDSGNYRKVIPYGWSGSATASFTNGGFATPTINYSTVTAGKANKNYVWTPPPVVSGRVTRDGTSAGIAGVAITFSNGAGVAVTDVSGHYSHTVPYKWSGSATASFTNGGFVTPSISYGLLTASQNGKNYVWRPSPTIAGRITRNGSSVPVSGVSVVAGNGGGSAVTGTNGYFVLTVPYGWSGVLTPVSGSGGTFTPPTRIFTSRVTANQSGKNFLWVMPAMMLLDKNPNHDSTTLAIGGFAEWATHHGLTGYPGVMFDQIDGAQGATYGAEYTFGNNWMPELPLIRLLTVDGVLTAEVPVQDQASLEDVLEQVEYSSARGSGIWFPATGLSWQSQVPANRQWFQAVSGTAAEYRVTLRYLDAP